MENKDQTIDELFQRAEQLRQAGNMDQIVPVFEQILGLDENEVHPNRFLAVWHSSRGNFSEAKRYYEKFNALVPNQEDMLLAYAVSLEETGDFQAALKILKRVVKLNENNLFPYVYLGSIFEKMGEKEKAGWAYSFAVDLNPALKAQDNNKVLPKFAVARIRQLNTFLENVGKDIQKGALKAAKKKFPEGDFSRVKKSVWRKLHSAKLKLTVEDQNPLSFFIPDLASGPWFEREKFPWGKELEDNFGLIRKELIENYRGDNDTLPYLQLGGYDPRSWGDLVGNKDWAAIHFYDGMEKKEANCKKFPFTFGLLDGLPLFKIGGKPVEVLFSVLKPRTNIPPHFGTSNARLTVHLPLIVPEGCFLTVGDEERPFREGKLMFFDDAFTHKARNNSDQVRIVLIFEIWHPDLRQEERAFVEEAYRLYEDWMKARDYDAVLDV